VVLVVLVRGCEVRAGPVRPVLLVPLRSAQAVLLLLPELDVARVALAHRDAPADLVRLGAVLFLVAGEPEAAAEALLLGLRRVRGLRLVGASAGLLVVALGRLRAALQLLERLLVERDARGMAMARGALRERLLLLLLLRLLSVLRLGHACRDLLRRRLLLLLLLLRKLLGGWVSGARARLVDGECFKFGVSCATQWAAHRALTGSRPRRHWRGVAGRGFDRRVRAIRLTPGERRHGRRARELPGSLAEKRAGLAYKRGTLTPQLTRINTPAGSAGDQGAIEQHHARCSPSWIEPALRCWSSLSM
jgi:hypothetical protein